MFSHSLSGWERTLYGSAIRNPSKFLFTKGRLYSGGTSRNFRTRRNVGFHCVQPNLPPLEKGDFTEAEPLLSFRSRPERLCENSRINVISNGAKRSEKSYNMP